MEDDYLDDLLSCESYGIGEYAEDMKRQARPKAIVREMPLDRDHVLRELAATPNVSSIKHASSNA